MMARMIHGEQGEGAEGGEGTNLSGDRSSKRDGATTTAQWMRAGSLLAIKIHIPHLPQMAMTGRPIQK